MKRSIIIFLFVYLIIFSDSLLSDYQTDFPPEEFQARWTKIFNKIEKDALVMVQSAPGTDGFKVFRQTNQFYYLCGLETPHSILLLDNRSRKVSLYLPHRNISRERGEGKVLSAEDAELIIKLTGVNAVHGIEMLTRNWSWRLTRTPYPIMYTPFSPAEGPIQSRDTALNGIADITADPWDNRPTREAHFISLLKKRYPQFVIKNFSPILDDLRIIKSPREIALIKRASQIASQGIMEAMRSTKPGIMEYQLDAAARFIFRHNGSRGVSYSSITAGGKNAWMGHYSANNAQLMDGDLVLMDFAPDYHYYTSDVTRLWPVNGKFSPAQRELCGFILKIHNAILKKIRPGITASKVLKEAYPDMEKIFKSIKWSKNIYQNAAKKAIKWSGHLSHPTGMAVHDVGNYKNSPLKPGVVFALDPMMWVPEEKLYIRIENMVVVTKTGAENLSKSIPSELDAIEKLMREKGIVQMRKVIK